MESKLVIVMMWACFSSTGAGPMVRIHGICDSNTYIMEILESVVEPYSDELPLAWIYQQDNATIHKSRIVNDYFKEHNWNVMKWPAQSPDINPIENLWTECDKHVKAKMPRTLDELEKAMIESWNMISARRCADLYVYMFILNETNINCAPRALRLKMTVFPANS